MNVLHIIYYVGIAVGIAMFVVSWLIRRKQITEGSLARAEKPLLLGERLSRSSSRCSASPGYEKGQL